MNDKDLFNAINEIDEKYVTAAWNDTDINSDTVVIRESGRPSKMRIIGLAAACVGVLGAAFLAVHIRVNQLPQDGLTPPADGIGVSDASIIGTVVSGASPIYHFGTEYPPRSNSKEPLPITLYGPDNVQITKADVTCVDTPDGKMISADEFDGDGWLRVECDDITYLAPPTGLSTNSLDDPELYADYALPSYGFDMGSFDNSDYKRYNVGDKYGALTLMSAKSIFRNNGSSPGECLTMCFAGFEGSVTLDAYLIRKIVDSPSGMVCVPMTSECPLPVMFPRFEDGVFKSKSYIGGAYLGLSMAKDFIYTSEYPAIYLQYGTYFYPGNLFDDDNDVAEVTITISDINMYWSKGVGISDRITAGIVDIRPKTADTQSEDALPFELYGPDYKQISYSDADDILDVNMNPISRADLTADNWDQIWCEGLCYLSAPAGANYNSIDDAECFNEGGVFKNMYVGMPPRYDYRRFKAGETFCGLKIENAMTVFTRTGEHSLGVTPDEELAAAEKLYMSIVRFSGETTLNAYIVDSGNVIFCIPLRGETGLPVMFPASDDLGNYTSDYRDISLETKSGQFFCRTELPIIAIYNNNGFDLSKYLGNLGYAKVALTLDNISMTYSRDNNSYIEANINSIRSFDGTISDSAASEPPSGSYGQAVVRPGYSLSSVDGSR
ncbi:MAG: hypothetical protein K2N38_09020 [Oscillospiraceae bacterium]|nr:hypothetical protein [Oscillospiraceae bacterium]